MAAATALLLCFSVGAKTKSASINGTKIQPSATLVGLITDTSSGKPVCGVPVTDGYTFTLTDANGVYQLVADDSARLVYYSLPAAYAVTLDSVTNRPAFYAPIRRDSGASFERHDFSLTPLPTPESEVTLVMIGDPQCRTDAEVMRLRNETLADLARTLADTAAYPGLYAFTLGDLTFDNVAMWPRVSSALSSPQLDNGRRLPMFNCVGNHDHDAAMTSDYDALHNYIDAFGPTDYSLDRGNIHIIVMDDIICTSRKRNNSTWQYIAGFTPRQLEWLRQDLANVPDKASKEVVFVCHIPFRGTTSGNQTEVLRMLAEFKDVHLMIGHTHYPHNIIHSTVKAASGRPVYEHIHGGACGAWWSCNSNTDGAPNGYSIYSFTPGGLRNWAAKSTGRPIADQMRVWNGSQVYGSTYPLTWHSGGVAGTNNVAIEGYPALDSCFVVELWADDGPSGKETGGTGNWNVELITASGQVLPMARIDTPIPNIPATAYFFNEMYKASKLWTHPSRHIWYVKAPGGDPAAEAGWTVRATQTIPYSGVSNVYESSELTTDYTIF